MLYALNLYRDEYQLFLNKTKNNKTINKQINKVLSLAYKSMYDFVLQYTSTSRLTPYQTFLSYSKHHDLFLFRIFVQCSLCQNFSFIWTLSNQIRGQLWCHSPRIPNQYGRHSPTFPYLPGHITLKVFPYMPNSISISSTPCFNGMILLRFS